MLHYHVETHAAEQLIARHKSELSYQQAVTFLYERLPGAPIGPQRSAHGDKIAIIDKTIHVVIKLEPYTRKGRRGHRYTAVTVLPVQTAYTADVFDVDNSPSLLDRVEAKEAGVSVDEWLAQKESAAVALAMPTKQALTKPATSTDAHQSSHRDVVTRTFTELKLRARDMAMGVTPTGDGLALAIEALDALIAYHPTMHAAYDGYFVRQHDDDRIVKKAINRLNGIRKQIEAYTGRPVALGMVHALKPCHARRD